MGLVEELKKIISGEVEDSAETLQKYSHDASLFEVKPQAVVFPKNSEDVQKTVKFVSENKAQSPALSITARSGGTDMTGGPLSESIILDFTKYFNRISVGNGEAITEPGVWYRDFEKETLKNGWLLPSYPASREICALGGMVSNNSGGEKTLKYGKTENYVEALKVVLSDGKEYEIKKLTKAELDQKTEKRDFEAGVYQKIFNLLDKNYELIKAARPQVSKNSAGYNIWNVWNKEKEEFDLVKLFVGAQGTLGVVTEAKLRLIEAKPYSGLLVMFINDLKRLPEVIHATLPFRPVSFESFDDHTFKLAIRFLTGLSLRLSWRFIPEVWLAITGGIPKLVLLAEFEGENQDEVDDQIKSARENLKNLKIKTIVANTEEKAKKYWVMRRESFNLLRHRVKGRRTAPYIDDLIVKPEHLPEFLPKLYEILDRYELQYTIAGHVGDGNFHIIPLMKLESEEEKNKIFQSMDEVYKLILKYGGSFTAEHNDGLIRSPYLKLMFGEKIYAIFEEIKNILDPQNIFNPGKKVGASLDYAKSKILLRQASQK